MAWQVTADPDDGSPSRPDGAPSGVATAGPCLTGAAPIGVHDDQQVTDTGAGVGTALDDRNRS